MLLPICHIALLAAPVPPISPPPATAPTEHAVDTTTLVAAMPPDAATLLVWRLDLLTAEGSAFKAAFDGHLEVISKELGPLPAALADQAGLIAIATGATAHEDAEHGAENPAQLRSLSILVAERPIDLGALATRLQWDPSTRRGVGDINAIAYSGALVAVAAERFLISASGDAELQHIHGVLSGGGQPMIPEQWRAALPDLAANTAFIAAVFGEHLPPFVGTSGISNLELEHLSLVVDDPAQVHFAARWKADPPDVPLLTLSHLGSVWNARATEHGFEADVSWEFLRETDDHGFAVQFLTVMLKSSRVGFNQRR